MKFTPYLFIFFFVSGCSSKIYQQEYKPSHNTNRSKLNVLFMDGTMNKPTKDTNENTNVLSMYNLVKPDVPKYYVEGVGNNGKVLGTLFGAGMGRRVRYSYRYLTSNYKYGDSIFIVGFSRGAFSSRVLSNLIYVAGIPDLQHFNSGKLKQKAIRKIYDRYTGDMDVHERRLRVAKYIRKWNERQPKYKIDLDTSGQVKIEALCLYETVEAMGAPDYVEEFRPRNKNHLYQADNINHVYHAVALDDNRAHLYTPILYTYPQIQQCTSRPLDSIVEEVWFSGAHSDIGGSMRTRTEIRFTTLNWMLSRLSHYNIFRDHEFKESNHLAVNNMQSTFFKFFTSNRNRDIPKYLQTISSCYNNGKINVHESVINRLADGNIPKFKWKKGRRDWFAQAPFDSCFTKKGDTWVFDPNCRYIRVVGNGR